MVYRWLDPDTFVAEHLVAGVTKRIYLTGQQQQGLVVTPDEGQDQLARCLKDARQCFYLRLAFAGCRLIADALLAVDRRGKTN